MREHRSRLLSDQASRFIDAIGTLAAMLKKRYRMPTRYVVRLSVLCY
jgi:hypothetical protein